MDKKDNRYYGEFGGQYVSESLMNTLDELEKAFDEAIKDPEFIKQYNYYLKEYVITHRIILNMAARMDGKDKAEVINDILKSVAKPAVGKKA